MNMPRERGELEALFGGGLGGRGKGLSEKGRCERGVRGGVLITSLFLFKGRLKGRRRNWGGAKGRSGG